VEKLGRDETYHTSQISIIREGMQSKGCDPETGKSGAPVLRSTRPAAGGLDQPSTGLFPFEGTWVVARERLAREGGGETPWGTLTLRKAKEGEGPAMAAQLFGKRSLAESQPCKATGPCQYYVGEVRWAPEWIEFRQRSFQNNMSGSARLIQQTALGRVIAASDGLLNGRFDGVEGVAGSITLEVGSNRNSTRGRIQIDGAPAVRFGASLILRRAQ
jgi:hypothetical protein